MSLTLTPGAIDKLKTELERKGAPLLVMQPALADRLSDAVLDVGQGADEPEWVLVRGGASP